MTDSVSIPSDLSPGVRFHYRSGLTGEIEPNVDYAALVLANDNLLVCSKDIVARPVKVSWVHGMLLVVEDPDAPPTQIELVNRNVIILGRWEDRVGTWYSPSDEPLTWRGYVAQQYGEVLRQRELAQRLSDFGIAREPEAYLPQRNTTNAVARSLTLNYDELDMLLRGAGF